MVSGFTDDRPLRDRQPRQFADNLELSAQRALTVTRALIDEGVPALVQLFAAAFGPGAAGGLECRRRRAVRPQPAGGDGAGAAGCARRSGCRT